MCYSRVFLDEEEPQVHEEDIEVKRTRMLELIRAQRAYNAIAEDGSRWVTFSPKRAISADPCILLLKGKFRSACLHLSMKGILCNMVEMIQICHLHVNDRDSTIAHLLHLIQIWIHICHHLINEGIEMIHHLQNRRWSLQEKLVICDHNEGSENSIILHHPNLIRNPNTPVVWICLWEKKLICLLQDNRGDGTILLHRNPS